jgi:hypothetical protein
MCETCLTNTLAKEKASVDKNIARTPSVRNFCRSLNLSNYRTAFFDVDPHPQSSPQSDLGRNALAFFIIP